MVGLNCGLKSSTNSANVSDEVCAEIRDTVFHVKF